MTTVHHAEQRQWWTSTATFAAGVLFGVLILEARPTFPTIADGHPSSDSQQHSGHVAACFAGHPQQSIDLARSCADPAP